MTRPTAAQLSSARVCLSKAHQSVQANNSNWGLLLLGSTRAHPSCFSKTCTLREGSNSIEGWSYLAPQDPIPASQIWGRPWGSPASGQGCWAPLGPGSWALGQPGGLGQSSGSEWGCSEQPLPPEPRCQGLQSHDYSLALLQQGNALGPDRHMALVTGQSCPGSCGGQHRSIIHSKHSFVSS